MRCGASPMRCICIPFWVANKGGGGPGAPGAGLPLWVREGSAIEVTPNRPLWVNSVLGLYAHQWLGSADSRHSNPAKKRSLPRRQARRKRH
jgi:hypothetical protein